MDFRCPNCNLTGNIDDAKVSETGIYAVCPKCQERFLVKKEPPLEPSWDFKPGPTAPADDPVKGDHPGAKLSGDNEAARVDVLSSPPPRAPAKTTASNSDADLQTFIGKNADKYLKRFDSFKKGANDGFAVTWHWPAFFVPFWWLIYRKQYWLAALAFVLSFIPFVGFLLMPVFGLTANYIYYRYSKNKLREISGIPSEMSRAVEIARAGGVNNIAIVVVPLVGVAIVGILAAIAIPQFAAYRMKAYNSAATSDCRNLKTCLEAYYADNQTYPGDIRMLEGTYKFTPSKEVEFRYDPVCTRSDKCSSYQIITQHKNGDRSIAATSDKPEIMYKLKTESDSSYRPL
jgi:Tfp pilus assembly protein PilE